MISSWSSRLPSWNVSVMSKTPAYSVSRPLTSSAAMRSRSMSGPISMTSTSFPAFIIENSKLTPDASGMGPVSSRHRLPSCSLVRVRSPDEVSSSETSPRCDAATPSANTSAPPGPRDSMGWSPTAAYV